MQERICELDISEEVLSVVQAMMQRVRSNSEQGIVRLDTSTNPTTSLVLTLSASVFNRVACQDFSKRVFSHMSNWHM
jgi:hypothetical protein